MSTSDNPTSLPTPKTVETFEELMASFDAPAECARYAHSDPTPEVEHPEWTKLRTACPLWGQAFPDKALVETMNLRRRASEDQIVVDLLAWAPIYRAATLTRTGPKVEKQAGWGRSRLALSVRMYDAVEANGGHIPTEWLGLGTSGIEKLLSKPKEKTTGTTDPPTSTLLKWVHPPKSTGIIATGNHVPRLDLDGWTHDIEDVDALPELPVAGTAALSPMLVVAPTRLRDRGDWEAVRRTCSDLLRDVGALLRDVGGDPVAVLNEEPDDFELLRETGTSAAPRATRAPRASNAACTRGSMKAQGERSFV